MREGGGRVVDVTEDTTITTFRGGVAHAHTVCPYTVRTVGRVDARRGRIQHFVSATVDSTRGTLVSPYGLRWYFYDRSYKK